MTAVVTVSPRRVSRLRGRRIGQFAVGTFAGLCATMLPRLSVQIAPAPSSAVEVQAFTAQYVVAAAVFSLIVGGVALILEWDGKRSPRDTFMAALGVPALLTGVFNSTTMSTQLMREVEERKAILGEQLEDAGIAVEEGPLVPAPQGGLRWRLEMMPTAHAQERTPVASPAVPAQKAQLGVRYVEQRYWVVLFSAKEKGPADERVAELGKRFGALSVKRAGEAFLVCLADGPTPYSDAARQAIEIQRRSERAITPRLVRAAAESGA